MDNPPQPPHLTQIELPPEVSQALQQICERIRVLFLQWSALNNSRQVKGTFIKPPLALAPKALPLASMYVGSLFQLQTK